MTDARSTGVPLTRTYDLREGLERSLRQLRDGLSQIEDAIQLSVSGGVAPVSVLSQARRSRNLQRRVIGHDLASHPVWDMLLDIAIAKLEGKTISVSSLCLAAHVPTTTALRWVNRLCKDGIIERTNDPTDGRRTLVRITDSGMEIMLEYVRQMERAAGSS